MNATVPIVTLDGPSGSGKGSVALQVVKHLAWHYLDSGAIYRVLGWMAGQRGVALDDIPGLVALTACMDLVFDAEHLYLNTRLVGDEIRTEQVGQCASKIAACAEIRQAVLVWQRARAVMPGLVAEGRDMGSVVFPTAKCKIYLTASAEVRAKRRFSQLRQKGFNVTMATVSRALAERDARDRQRKESPLKPAADACILDTSELSMPATVATVLQRVADIYAA